MIAWRMGLAGAALVLLGLAGCSKTADQPAAPSGPPRFELTSTDPVKHGERLSKVLGCSGCHTDTLTGQDWSDDLGTLWTANLTQSAVRYSHDELVTMITQGRRPDRALLGMPSYLFNGLNPADIDAVVAYLETLEPAGVVHPQPTMSKQLVALIAKGELHDSAGDVAANMTKGPPDFGEAHAYGRFIIRATCVECHGIELQGTDEIMEEGGNTPPNLRIAASYSDADFTRLMRTGVAAGDREAGLMSKVARRRYANFTDAELAAVRGYLVELAKSDP